MQPVALVAGRGGVLDVDVERAVGVVGQALGAVADRETVDRVFDQLEIGAIHGEGPEAVLQRGGIWSLSKWRTYWWRRRRSASILVAAEIFRLGAIVHEQALEGAGGAIEIIVAVIAGAQIVPPRGVWRAAVFHLPLHDLWADRDGTGEAVMGGFVERGDIHRLAQLDAAAAEQDDSGFLIGGGGFSRKIGRGLEPGEIAGVVRARAEFGDCGLAEFRRLAQLSSEVRWNFPCRSLTFWRSDGSCGRTPMRMANMPVLVGKR